MSAILNSINSLNSSAEERHADLPLMSARKRSLQRTVQALFRETILCKEQLIVEGTIAWLPLWSQQGLLRFEGLQIGRIGNCQLQGTVSYYKTGEQPQPIATAAALLACVAPLIGAETSLADQQRFLHELDNSVENDALCLNYRRSWAKDLMAEFGSQESCFIAALRSSAHPNPVLLLEQWGTLGHPWHPTYKTKLGLTSEEVIALSPEFQPTIQVQLAAIRREKARVTFAHEGSDYADWFAQTYPDSWANWTDALRQQGLQAEEWLPLPLHPYQAQRLVPEKFAREIADGDVVMLPQVQLPASPTMSFRTVVPESSPAMPHMKLPVSLRLTSVQRTVSPKSAVMGPRLTKLLSTIVAREQGFGGVLDIIPENLGVHFIDPDGNDDRARHLSVLYRGNPMTKVSPDLFPVPVGALFADSPADGRPLIADLVGLSYGDHAAGAVKFYEQYAASVLKAALSTYLVYGIAFEAHQQNSFIMVNQQYQPVQLLVRDFGDMRVHAPTLRAAGMELVPYRAGHTVYEEEGPVRDKILHAVMLCHLSEIALLLARTYAEPEDSFWDVLRDETVKVFADLRDRTGSKRWFAERHALLEADWPAKAFLRMRLQDTSDDVHGQMQNPLRMAAR